MSSAYARTDILDSPWKPKNKIKIKIEKFEKIKLKMERVNSQEVKEDEDKAEQDGLLNPHFV